MQIQIKNLDKKYPGGFKALSNIDLTIENGMFGLLGPNGAGKSTTMKIITGFIQADAGQVQVMGKNALQNPKEVSPLIGYLPEHNPLYLDMYVREFLEFSAGIYGVKGKKRTVRIEELLKKTGLLPEQHKKIGQLSKGYRQRVGLAKALIHDPQVIILDEPTTGLDPNQLVEIRNLISEIAKEKTLILSTHIMQEVEAICHDVVIINKGKILAAEPLENLTSKTLEVQLELETEEALELSWFESIGTPIYGKKGNTSLLISCQDPVEARKSVMRIVQEKDLNLMSLNQSKKNLEQIFREITK